MKILGIDLGGTSIKFAVFNDAEIIKKWSIPTNTKDKGVFIISEIIQSIKSQNIDFDVAGMCMPGAVNDKAGVVIGAYNVGWDTTQYIVKDFINAFNKQVFIANDANAAALGEKWQGAASDSQNIVLITLGTGVGGGVVLNGNLVVGNTFAAGEIGHMNIERNNEFAFQCSCGNIGCLETVASATGISRLARKMINQELTSREIFNNAERGDENCLMVVEKFCEYLGLACSNIANILNVEAIVIGGGVSEAGDFLLTKIKHYFVKYSFSAVRNTQINIASLNNDAGIFGAAFLAISNYKVDKYSVSKN